VSKYRFSVIPAGAITDESLEPRDLQVLCLLGRHTNDMGWCWRSQVKMARELRCGRSSVQRSIERLVDAGWVEKKLRGRDGTEPNEDKQPFAPYAYRVCLDGDDRKAAIHATQDRAPEGGEVPISGQEVPTGGHPGAQPYVGTGCPATDGHPYEGSPEGSPLEPDERESPRAREGEERGERLVRVKAKWPTAALDDQDRIDLAWNALPDAELQPAEEGIEPFLKALKAHKRGHCPTLWRYLEERRWNLIPAKVEQPAAKAEIPTIRCWSREWWALLIAKLKAGDRPTFMVSYASQPGKLDWGVKAGELPHPADIAAYRNYPSDGPEMEAWRPWFEQRGIRLPVWREKFWVFLPSPTPQSKAGSTGPPLQPASDEELADYA
jgi:hypothetical protein